MRIESCDAKLRTHETCSKGVLTYLRKRSDRACSSLALGVPRYGQLLDGAQEKQPQSYTMLCRLPVQWQTLFYGGQRLA